MISIGGKGLSNYGRYWYNSLIISTNLETFATPDYGVSSNQQNYPNTRFGISTSIVSGFRRPYQRLYLFQIKKEQDDLCFLFVNTPTHARTHTPTSARVKNIIRYRLMFDISFRVHVARHQLAHVYDTSTVFVSMYFI